MFILFIIAMTLETVWTLPPFIAPPPECKSFCSVPVRNLTSGIIDSVDCDFLKDTYECELKSREFTNSSSTTTCSRSQVITNFTPYAYDHPNYITTLSLNISLSVLDHLTRAVAFRLICLHSGSVKEFYCENKTRPAHWDQFYWPCRLFDFSSITSYGSDIVFPLQYYHDCYRLSPFSLFMVNVTLYPQNCVASYVFQMPSLANVLAKTVPDWLPLVTVDTNEDDGVWIHFSLAPSFMRIREVVVEVYEILSSDEEATGQKDKSLIGVRKVFRKRGTVFTPNTSIFFADLPKGSYLGIVFAQHDQCDQRKCIQMQIPFNLTKDHYTLFTREEIESKMRLSTAWVPVTAAVVGIIGTFLIISVAVAAYLRWKAAQRKRTQDVSYIQFTRRPVILVLYTNDFPQHRRCVLELANYLKSRANCDIELDEWALSSSTSNGYNTPIEWLVHALQRADYYLMVFSIGTNETVFRRSNSSYFELQSERPWDETFAPAMNYVLQQILQATRNFNSNATSEQNTTAFRRFICVRFIYSPPDTIPDICKTLPCPKFCIPDDLRQLICHIHELPRNSIYESGSLDIDRLNFNIADSGRFLEANPDWLANRLVERQDDETNDSQRQLNETTAAIGRLRAPTLQQLPDDLNEFYANLLNRDLDRVPNIQLEEQYQLIPPSSVEEQESAAVSQNHYELLPPDDDELGGLFYSGGDSSRSQAHS